MFAIYGSGGFGRELIEPAREQLARLRRDPDEIVFIDDNAENWGKTSAGIKNSFF